MNFRIVFDQKVASEDVVGNVNSDYAVDLNYRRLMTGYTFMFLWRSHLLKVYSLQYGGFIYYIGIVNCSD